MNTNVENIDKDFIENKIFQDLISNVKDLGELKKSFKKLENEYPNDYDLGKVIRKIINNL